MTKDDCGRLAVMLADEASKARKLEIIFGNWWRHYAVPYEFLATLYTERSVCPYCNTPLDNLAFHADKTPGESESAHLDHMDPLSRGGEDSILNTLYVCRKCNLAKGKQLFVDWLERLDPKQQRYARQVYEEKHGHTPEEFQPGIKQARLTSRRYELGLDESVLRALFKSPIVTGPPERKGPST